MRRLLPILFLAFTINGYAQFTNGNLVIYRVGTGGSTVLASSGNAVFLDEYTPTGTLVRSLAIPSSDPDGSGPNHQLIASGTATSEGLMNRSVDGKYLVLTGYAANTGTSGVASTTSATVPRVVGLVDYQDNINTSTALTDFASGNNIRSATSIDGTAVWASGATGSVHYAAAGATTSTAISATLANLRDIAIYQNQLYISTSSGSAIRIGTVGTGVPTTTGQTITNLPGFATSTGSPYQFVLFDLDASTPGPDVMYVADDGIGLSKYSLVGGNWVLNGTVGVSTDSYRGLTGTVSGTTVTLYGTRNGGSTASGGGDFISITDATGYNAAFSGTPTLLATAAANTAFRGIALAPTSGSTPNNLSLTFNTTANTAILPPFVSGTINDATDPALTPGVTVTVQENAVSIPAANYTLTASSSNTTVVANNGITVNTFDGLAVVKINPTGIGYSDITLTLSKGGNTKTLVINYAASSSSATTTTYWHTGTSDASAAIALDDDYMVIGDDEHNILYVYGRHQPGLPVTTFDFNQGNLLGLTDGTPGAYKELDVEMGTRSTTNPATMYWMGSMSNSSSFNNKPNRDMIIAVTASGTGAATSFTNAGHYAGLRAQVVAWGDAHGYNFTASAADGVDPKTISGFNLEGMVFGPDNTTMYLGFRAPLVPTANRTNAVIAPIQNFEAWFNNGAPTGSATIGAPIELNLGGRGIRDLIRLSNGNYIILAGSYDGTSNPAVYTWNGLAGNQPVQQTSFDVSALNPEAAVEIQEGGVLSPSKLQIISDDGDQVYYGDGVEAKDLPNDNFKKFNSAIVVSPLNALPIQFETFTAVRQNTSVLLNWKTGDPGTIDVFDIQRSVNGIDFTTIGSVSAAAGREAYTFTDNQPGAATKIYYRINAKEITGNSYLSTIRVVGGSTSEIVKLYPNPASNGVTTLTVTTPGEKHLAIYNSNGQLQGQYTFSESTKDISTAGWAAGYYLVRIAVNGVLVTTTTLAVQ